MDLSYQFIFVVNFLLCFFAMKALSWVMTPAPKRLPFFWFLFTWPYLSLRSLRVVAPPPATSSWSDFLLYSVLTATIFVGVHQFLSPIGYADRIVLGVGIYFFTEALGALGQSLFSWRNEYIYPIHHRPLASPSLSEFWGRRWNLWVQDWIADVGSPFRGSHKTKILASFFFSGLFHEAMVNLPHWIISGESYFGTMLGYFVIQGVGLYFDKKIFRHHFPPAVRRIYGWLIVVLPAPLFINVPLLKFFGMTE